MIYSLDGTVSVVLPTAMVITVNHVGYMVHCTQPVITTVAVGDHRQLIIYHHIREDAQVLYGFESSHERNLFETLISVSGIGPKVGMGILSNMTPAHLVHAIQTDNIMLMTQLPGIGKKTAERMMVELKDKMNAFAVPEGTPTTPSATIEAPTHDSDDIVMALKQLGYQKDEIKRAFMKHATELASVDAIESQIKILLKYL